MESNTFSKESIIDYEKLTKAFHIENMPHLDQIIRFEANRQYTDMILENRKRVTLSVNIGKVAKELPVTVFAWIHQHHLINIFKITQAGHNYIIMNGGAQIPMSRRKKKNLLPHIEKPFINALMVTIEYKEF